MYSLLYWMSLQYSYCSADILFNTLPHYWFRAYTVQWTEWASTTRMLDDWKKTTLILCSYGFFKEIRPSEPFLTEYLIGNSTGLSAEQVTPSSIWPVPSSTAQVYQDVYPIWTYSYLAVLVIVFLFTDLARWCLCLCSNYNTDALQVQTSHCLWGFLLHLDLDSPVVGSWSLRYAVHASILWDSHLHRGCLLHLHLRPGPWRVLPTSDKLHQERSSPWQVPFWCLVPASD